MKYKKRPVVIDAFQLGVDPQPDWFKNKILKKEIDIVIADYPTHMYAYERTDCFIKTLEGTMKGDYKDYIIQGVKGEIYPCKPDIFELTYEPYD